MALSPNYGFPEPDNSSLVKNGAQDIRALGDAVDTALWNVGYGQAGKNKIINGDFGIWQRGTSFTNAATNTYTTDRFYVSSANSTIDVNRSTFTAGAAPVAGYESQYFATIAAEATDTDARFQQPIEDVRTFAGQTITVSFWAKSNVTTDALKWVRAQQFFGSGGSATVNTDSAAITLTSSWARYSVTLTVPSISGKTLGTGNFLNIIIGLKASTAQTLDLWGVQAEYGSKATPFETATGTIQGELAACQRYYYRANSSNAYGIVGSGIGYNSTTCAITTALPVSMRVVPSSVDFSTLSLFDIVGGNNTVTTCTLDTNQTTFNTGVANISAASGITNYRTYYIRGNASSSAYIAYNAEL